MAPPASSPGGRREGSRGGRGSPACRASRAWSLGHVRGVLTTAPAPSQPTLAASSLAAPSPPLPLRTLHLPPVSSQARPAPSHTVLLRALCTPSELPSGSSVPPPVKPSCAEGLPGWPPCPRLHLRPHLRPHLHPCGGLWPGSGSLTRRFLLHLVPFMHVAESSSWDVHTPALPSPRNSGQNSNRPVGRPLPAFPVRKGGSCVRSQRIPQPLRAAPMNNCFQTASLGATGWIFHAAPSDCEQGPLGCLVSSAVDGSAH